MWFDQLLNKKAISISLLAAILSIGSFYLLLDKPQHSPKFINKQKAADTLSNLKEDKKIKLSEEQKQEYQALSEERAALENINQQAKNSLQDLKIQTQDLLQKDQQAEKIIAELEAGLKDK